jgi:hypothetical protein
VHSSPLTPKRVLRFNPTDPDPAIDTEKTDLRAYITTRELDGVVFVPDSNPVYFNVDRLPQAFLTDVLDAVFPLAARRLLAFRAAVHRVEDGNGPVASMGDSGNQDGPPLVAYTEKLAPKGAAFVCRDGEHGTDVAPVAFAQAVGDLYGAETIQELGQVALDFARLPRGKKGPFTSWAGSVASG